MIAAALAGHHLKMTACESSRRTRAAEMDEGREILLLAGGGLRLAGAGENLSNMAVQINRRELDRMARDRADIKASEAAAIIHHRMVPDTGAGGLVESAIGHLKQADGARRWLVDRERVETPSPAPIGAVHRIARTLDLRQRGQQFRRDRAGGMLAKQRPVLPPRLGRLLVEPVTDEGEQLSGLEDHVIDEVHERCDRKQDRHAARDLNHPGCCRELPSRPTRAPAPAAKVGAEALGSSWHALWERRHWRYVKPVAWVELLAKPIASGAEIDGCRFARAYGLKVSLRNMMNVLFVCSANRLRSPTAEQVFSTWPGVETDSAGISSGASVLLSSEQVDWADVIFVMEKTHRNKLVRRFRSHLKSKRVICLDIPDDYEFMDSVLVRMLEKRVGRFLPQAGPALR